jgi:hypothetical protein
LFEVENAGQLSCSVPEPGFPFAMYTVPCTVVVLIVCVAAFQTRTTAANQIPIHLPALHRVVFVSFIRVSLFFLAAPEFLLRLVQKSIRNPPNPKKMP